MSDRLNIYVAGPLFTARDRKYLEQIRDVISSCDVDTFLPHEENADNEKGRTAESSREELEEIFKKDYEAVKVADAIVAVLDGVPVDAGTAWELGYGFALLKPILGVRSDFRVLGNYVNQRVDLMTEAACTKLLFVPQEDFKFIENGIKSFIQELKAKKFRGCLHFAELR